MKPLNARSVLTAAELTALQPRCEGKQIYFPVRRRRRFKTASLPARDRRIRCARAAGASLAQIAKKFPLSLTRISEICRGIQVGRRCGRRNA